MVDARYSAGDAAYRCLLGQSVAGSNPTLFTMFLLNLYITHFRQEFDSLTLINQKTKYIIMEEQLVSFETAKLAKEKGFNESCIHGYLNKDGSLMNDDDHFDFNSCYEDRSVMVNLSRELIDFFDNWEKISIALN